MKKIILFIIVFCVCFYSCQVPVRTFIKYLPEVVKEMNYVSKETRMSKKTEIIYHYEKKAPFVLENGKIYIPCKINNTTHLLFYDTDDLFADFCEQISGNVDFPKTNKTIKVRTTIQGVTMKKGLQYYNIESDFFDFKQYVGKLISISNDSIIPKCVSGDNKERFHFGISAFPKWGDIMLLNFSDTTITILDSNNIYDTTDFTLVKSVYTCRGLDICLTVDSIEYKFLFNTDNKGFLSLSRYEKHKKEDDIFLTGYRREYSSIIIDTLIHQYTNTITMGNLDSITGNILYLQKAFRPTVGMAFISWYDWIIDMNNEGKVYAKKIKDIQSKKDLRNFHQVNVFDITLQISLVPVGETKYQLFSIVDSINGEKVTMDNICQMKDLLNQKNGFEDNEIVILPSPKSMFLKE